MASLRRQRKVWFACLTLSDGTRTQRSTGIKDIGEPKDRYAGEIESPVDRA